MAGDTNKLAQEGLDAYLAERGLDICGAYKQHVRKGSRNPRSLTGDARAYLYLRSRMPSKVVKWMEEA